MKRRFIAIAGAAVLAACQGDATPTASKSPLPSPSQSPSPVGTPLPVLDLPLSAVDVSCRLPVTVMSSGGDFVTYQGGFVTLPQGTFVADKAGLISSGYVTADFFNTTYTQLRGVPQTGPPFYDVAVRRWVPAGAGQASPDGLGYAYGSVAGTNNGTALRITVVDIRSATQRMFSITPTSDFGAEIGAAVFDYDGASVFFSTLQNMGPDLGVWRLDVSSGAVTKLSGALGVAAVRNGYAWVDRIDPRDPEGPQTGRSGPRSNSVVRIDLTTGQETVWYYAAGNQVFFEGFGVDGNPLISVSFPTTNFQDVHLLEALTPNGDVVAVYDGARGLSFSGPQPDPAGRLWLGSSRGIYLFTAAHGLQKVYALEGAPVGEANAVLPAGFCV